MANQSAAPTLVVMAKAPHPGLAKRRLAASGLGDESAARIADVMLRCTVERLSRHGHVIVACTPDATAPALAALLTLPAGRVVPQGAGDLGARILRVWQRDVGGGPAAFFGCDAPDIPHAHIEAIARALEGDDLAMGPTTDGGYWTLAGRAPAAAALEDMPWGTGSMACLTRRRASDAGLTVAELPLWYDVDDVADLQALHVRLAAAHDDPALERLMRRLDEAQSGPATRSGA